MASDTTWMGFILCVVGAVVSITIIGAIVGIPMILLGLTLILWRWVRWPFAKLWKLARRRGTKNRCREESKE